MKKVFDIFSKTRANSITSMYNSFNEMFDIIVEEHRKLGLSPVRFFAKGFVSYDKDGNKIIKEFSDRGSEIIIKHGTILNTCFPSENINGFEKVIFDRIFDGIFLKYGLCGIHSVMLDTDYIMDTNSLLKYCEDVIDKSFDGIKDNGDIDDCVSKLVSTYKDEVNKGIIYKFEYIVEKNGVDRINVQLVCPVFGERIYDVLVMDGKSHLTRIK